MASKPRTDTRQAEAPAEQPGPKPKRAGPPTKRTPETRKALLDAIELGLSDKSSCNYACVSVEFFRQWQEDDVALVADVQRARGKFIASNQERIRRAADTDWKAAAWLLARRQPDEYAERSVIEAVAHCPLDKLFEPIDEASQPDDSPLD